ncbi:hypothetical protein [Bacteroides sp.]|uniref:fimbrial tip adhesin FimD n=1 Tax=Bacteroides sp. TaxID=29523 RepID=UPI00259107F6|nr:hypothetical protein [Bacteroides sp.]
MKKILFTILKTALLLPLLAACSSETDSFLPGTGTEGNAIVLQFSTGDVPQSRATVPSEEGAEVAVEHLDVFIFEESGGKKHYERVGNCADKQGTVTLAAKREDFEVNTGYWVYLIANSTHETAKFETITDLNSLKAMTQEDKDIFLTGITNIPDAPQSFLMDGIAYEATAAQEPAASAPVVLCNGVKSEDTKLKVTLRRAAAKIIVHIYKGGKVTFDNSLEVGGQKVDPGYYLRNMPYTTSLLAGVGGEADLTTPGKMYNQYFAWTKDSITVTAYAYAHEWANASLEKEVRLVVNIPMKYTDESGKETEHVSSYYQIPISKDKVLKRNTCYQVTVTVNAPGALDPSEPEELTEIQYSVKDWEKINVDINGDDRPIFLYVNEEEMQMRNINEDSTTLEFASSSAVSATIDSVYYIDKFGQKQVLEKINDSENDYGISTGGWWPTWNNRCTIKITPDKGINGKLDVYSTLPENNTIRYIVFEVTNAEGITREVTVAQYPLEYITNVQGKYSTRSDFGGTTLYEKGNNGYVIVDDYNARTDTWGTYRNARNEFSRSGFFRSKYVRNKKNDGSSTISYYYWPQRGNSVDYYSTSSDLTNARMYHVRITASSGDYTLGRPRITDGKTDPDSDNAELVSPSFMIASQLGAVASTDCNSVAMAASHCKEYVEVDEDGTVYDDWRLPTAAEIRIIMKFQKVGEAIDEVLSGSQYWCASGCIRTSDGEIVKDQGSPIRCIRDAYDDK